MNAVGTGRGLAVAMLLLVALTACAGRSPSEPPERPLRLKRIELSMADNANQDWPARVELVRMKDARLADELLRFETDDWFGEGGRAFKNGHPEVFFDDWEVVPGTTIGPFDVRLRDDVVGVLFCDTRADPPPLRFERNGDVMVRVEEGGCTLDGGRPSREKSLWRFD